MTEAILEIAGLRKRFGSLAVTDGVSLTVQRGETHALIGPNGAGKTTLISQVTGEIAPDAGTIRFNGRDITRLSVPQRAHLGLSRSFQITSVFDSFTPEGNVALAVQATQPHSFRFWQRAGALERLTAPARRFLADVGLEWNRADVGTAASLSHGERRKIEIAMTLADNPVMLLLDEPMAGLGVEESRAMTELLARIKARYSILLVEHDMDVVFSLADRISVLANGRVIASGTADAVRRHPEVRSAYLGEDDEFV